MNKTAEKNDTVASATSNDTIAASTENDTLVGESEVITEPEPVEEPRYTSRREMRIAAVEAQRNRVDPATLVQPVVEETTEEVKE